ncbi:MAG: hypothetical protein ACRDP7_21640 [Trebonia sp.]
MSLPEKYPDASPGGKPRICPRLAADQEQAAGCGGGPHRGPGDFTVYDTQADPEPEPAGLATLLIDHQVRTADYLILLPPRPAGAAWPPRPHSSPSTTASASPPCA